MSHSHCDACHRHLKTGTAFITVDDNGERRQYGPHCIKEVDNRPVAVWPDMRSEKYIDPLAQDEDKLPSGFNSGAGVQGARYLATAEEKRRARIFAHFSVRRDLVDRGFEYLHDPRMDMCAAVDCVDHMSEAQADMLEAMMDRDVSNSINAPLYSTGNMVDLARFYDHIRLVQAEERSKQKKGILEGYIGFMRHNLCLTDKQVSFLRIQCVLGYKLPKDYSMDQRREPTLDAPLRDDLFARQRPAASGGGVASGQQLGLF